MTAIKEQLTTHGIFPYRGRGQHFLIQKKIAERVVGLCDVNKNDIVVEIGPGMGALTEIIAERAKKLITIESDRKLAELISDRFSPDGVKTIFADALKFDFNDLGEELGEKFKVIANLPYNISTEMIFTLLDASNHISIFVLMLQKEVARRLTAPPGTKEYGLITVMASLNSDISIGFSVGRGNFYPKPKVDSAVVVFRPFSTPKVEVGEIKVFKAVVRAAFGKRRKTLRNALKSCHYYGIADVIPVASLETVEEKSGIDLNRRGETLSLEEFGRLSRTIKDILSGFPFPNFLGTGFTGMTH